MIGQLLLNRYRLDSELGQGGMGVVYRATDTLLQRPVAVKMLNATGLGTQGRARLLAEARATAKLNHPNIVTVHDAGETDGQPFIVLELVEGASLRDAWPKTLDDSLAIARQVCAALDHAHTSGIIHRDLKPENVVLTKSQTAKLMDFGLAHSADAEPDSPRLTEEGAVVGTFAYLAPELLMGQPATAQSDLYALGVMLYELATGHMPFVADNLGALIVQQLQAQPTPPREHPPEVPPVLEALILALLSKDPAERPPSAADVANTLVGLLSPEAAALVPQQPAVIKTNLPVTLTTFIGREREMGEIKQLLAAPGGRVARLVTLTGSGGVGKTRLSLQVASELLGKFTHGAWLVELAPLTDPALLPETVVNALGVMPSDNTPVMKTLTNYLRAKRLLLVLDNCEHLIEACACLAEALLRACPGLQILTSSREALGIAGETIYHVPSLTLPDPHGDWATIGGSESVRLFVERATAVMPSFAFTAANATSIAKVCHRLDGIALAIELAAARVKLLQVDQIVTRLENAFKLLTGGSRTALPRQQTLRATIDWSYTLLADDERALLRRLAVFMGGWTLEAAEAVGDELEVLHLLTRLVDKSLVVAEREPGHEARYHLLETVRQYAREKLAESGESEATRGRHLRYFVAWIQETAPRLQWTNQREWLKHCETDLDNLRTALEWGLEADRPLGLQLASTLWWYWKTSQRQVEGQRWLTSYLDQPGQTYSMPLQAEALARLALLYELFDSAKEKFYAEQSLALTQGKIDPPALAYDALGYAVARSSNDYSAAAAHWDQAERLAHQQGNLFVLADASSGRAFRAWRLGERDMAQNYGQEALRLHLQLGNQGSAAIQKNWLGMLMAEAGDLHTGRRLQEEMKLTLQSVGRRVLFDGLGWTAIWQGDYATADKEFQEFAANWKDAGSLLNQAGGLFDLAYSAAAQGQDARAWTLMAAAKNTLDQAAISQEHKQYFLLGCASDNAQICLWLGDDTQAQFWLYLETEANPLPLQKAGFAWRRGELAFYQGRWPEALPHLRECLKFYHRNQTRIKSVQILETLAECLFRQDQLRLTAQFFGAATAFRAQTGMPQFPRLKPHFDAIEAELKKELGEAAFAAAWAEGQALGLDGAVASVLAESQ